MVKNLPANAGDNRFNLWVKKIPWRRNWQTHSGILAWKIPWRSLAGCSPWGCKRVGSNWAHKFDYMLLTTFTDNFYWETETCLIFMDFSLKNFYFVNGIDNHTVHNSKGAREGGWWQTPSHTCYLASCFPGSHCCCCPGCPSGGSLCIKI